MNLPNQIHHELQVRAAAYKLLDNSFAATVAELGVAVAKTFRSGGKLLTCGNGGSAAEAQHLAEELIGRFRNDRAALPALALTSDGTALTCIANDFGFEHVFARQVQGLARPGDTVIALSTSGNSPNLLAALQAARLVGATTAGLLGGDGGALRALCDHIVIIPAQRSDVIQEVQLTVVHLLCAIVEQELGMVSRLTP